MDRIAVLIPCFNEASSVAKVVHDFRAALPDAAIYVYDNNSTDGTPEIAEKAGAIVRHESRQGKGNVVRRMFQDIDAECYIMADGDDAFPAEDSIEMAGLVLGGNIDMVIGDRLTSTHAVDKNMKIVNRPVNYRERPDGTKSKLRTIPDGFKVIRTILQLFSNYEPFKFFGMLSLFLAVLSVLFFLPVFAEYLRTGLVARFPTLIVCGFVMIVALHMFFAGIILRSIKNRECHG